MKLSVADLSELADLAISAACEAGQMIARSRPQDVRHKAGVDSLASQVVTEIDRRSEDIILEMLEPTLERFEFGLLTEEQDDDGGRLTADHFWCIDPLDGTLPFIEGVPGYAVSIALVARDGRPQLGVIHDPVGATTWHAISGVGLFRDRDRWTAGPQRTADVLSVFADRSFLERVDNAVVVGGLREIAGTMGLDDVRIEATAGAVMNACRVLANPPACYVKYPSSTGGGSLWDFAATTCLFHESGSVVTDIHGDPLDLNRPDSTGMAHRGILFATDEELAGRIRAMYAQRS